MSIDHIVSTRMLCGTVQNRLLESLDIVIGNSFRIGKLLGDTSRHGDLEVQVGESALLRGTQRKDTNFINFQVGIWTDNRSTGKVDTFT